jgi:hypothetical protein
MKRSVLILALGLFLLSFVIIVYRILWLNYPFFPATPEEAWELSMTAYVKADQNEIEISVGFPMTHGGQIISEESITSGNLVFNLHREGENQIGVWSGHVEEGERIGYRAAIFLNPEKLSKNESHSLEPFPPTISPGDQVLAKRLVAKWDALPPAKRFWAVAAAINGRWGSSSLREQNLRAWLALREKHGSIQAPLILLRAANLPAQAVEGLPLSAGVRTSVLAWIRVWTGEGWENMRPETGEIYPKSILFLPLATEGHPSVQLSRGEIEEIRWTMSRQVISQWRLHFERIKRSDRLLDRWSLFRLPSDSQETFRILLLVPIGALMICVLRNLVGFPTFGIFMPVLMALAFRNTGLLYGLGIFFSVILIGYGVRRFLERLHLLLVPRLSVILTLVIISFIIFGVTGNEYGLRQFMAVGLLPFVILTMAIERFFVVTEEAGFYKGLQTAGGSAAVAAITYLLIHLELLQLAFFVYPELLFAVAAVQVLLGRYTGYRISEFIRFRWLRKDLS